MPTATPERPSTDEQVVDGEVLGEEVPHALVPLPKASGLLSPEQVAAEVSQPEVYRECAHASNTLKAYRTDWGHFSVYCAERGARPLPADALVVRTYLSFCADCLGLKISTLRRRLAAITHYHRQAGLSFDRSDGAFLETWRGGEAGFMKLPVTR